MRRLLKPEPAQLSPTPRKIIGRLQPRPGRNTEPVAGGNNPAKVGPTFAGLFPQQRVRPRRGLCKFALGKSLLELVGAGHEVVSLEEFAVPFARSLCDHLQQADKQMNAASRRRASA
jgi:hypothetical protein